LKKEKQFSDSDKSSDSSDLDIKPPSKNINKTAPIKPQTQKNNKTLKKQLTKEVTKINWAETNDIYDMFNDDEENNKDDNENIKQNKLKQEKNNSKKDRFAMFEKKPKKRVISNNKKDK